MRLIDRWGIGTDGWRPGERELIRDGRVSGSDADSFQPGARSVTRSIQRGQVNCSHFGMQNLITLDTQVK